MLLTVTITNKKRQLIKLTIFHKHLIWLSKPRLIITPVHNKKLFKLMSTFVMY